MADPFRASVTARMSSTVEIATCPPTSTSTETRAAQHAAAVAAERLHRRQPRGMNGGQQREQQRRQSGRRRSRTGRRARRSPSTAGAPALTDGGRVLQIAAMPPRSIHAASTRPAMPASAAISRPSANSCRTIPAAAGAEREADRNLAAARERPGEHHVGDVGARGGEHQAECREHRREHRRELHRERVGRRPRAHVRPHLLRPGDRPDHERRQRRLNLHRPGARAAPARTPRAPPADAARPGPDSTPRHRCAAAPTHQAESRSTRRMPRSRSRSPQMGGRSDRRSVQRAAIAREQRGPRLIAQDEHFGSAPPVSVADKPRPSRGSPGPSASK